MKIYETAIVVIGRGNNRQIASCAQFVSAFRKTCWQTAQLATSEECSVYYSSEKLLPPGEWPGKTGGGLHLSERGTGPQVDEERVEFFKGLHPSLPDIVDELLGRAPGYHAFVFTGVVVVESFREGNATYLYDASNPSWFKHAQLTKYEHKYNPPSSFIKREVHRGDWQARIRARLE